MIVFVLLAACGDATATTAPQPTTTPAVTTAPAAATTASQSTTSGVQPTSTVAQALPTATVAAQPTNTQAAAVTTAPQATATKAAQPTSAPTSAPTQDNPYTDDRSDGKAVIASFYNAINRHEYLRAYSYWEAAAQSGGQVPAFDAFQKGYANTASVQATFGQMTGDAAAGQYYNGVPVALTATTTDGKTQYFAGCYTTHLSNPAIQATSPFKGRGIGKATVAPVDSAKTATEKLVTACANTGSLDNAQPPVASVDPASYYDNRSDGIAAITSFYNAINRHEYLRAYSYWEAAAQKNGQVSSYTDFEKGYANTDKVAVTFGKQTNDVGAGQLRYSVPVTITSTQKDGSTKTFTGSYVLHLGSPTAQATPPFQPLAIESASIK